MHTVWILFELLARGEGGDSILSTHRRLGILPRPRRVEESRLPCGGSVLRSSGIWSCGLCASPSSSLCFVDKLLTLEPVFTEGCSQIVLTS